MMSKYQEKIKKRYYETESGRIAYDIAERLRNMPLVMDFEMKLDGGITVSPSDDHLAIYVWKDVPYKANRAELKVLPRVTTHRDQIADILDAQSWVYF